MSKIDTDEIRSLMSDGFMKTSWLDDTLDEIDWLREVMELGVPDEAGTVQRTKEAVWKKLQVKIVSDGFYMLSPVEQKARIKMWTLSAKVNE